MKPETRTEALERIAVASRRATKVFCEGEAKTKDSLRTAMTELVMDLRELDAFTGREKS